MSDENKIVPSQSDLPDTDLNSDQLQRVQDFIESGMPGIATIDESKHAKMLELYLGGSSYDRIASVMRTNRTLIMFLSFKSKWFEARQSYLLGLEEHMKRRVVETKLIGQDFLLTMVQALTKKMTKKVNKYLATDDEKHMDEINLKELDRYLKMLESLNSSIQPPKSDAKAPAVSLNLGDGVTVTKKNDNEVEITPKQKTISDTLAYYADLRRQEDKNREGK